MYKKYCLYIEIFKFRIVVGQRKPLDQNDVREFVVLFHTDVRTYNSYMSSDRRSKAIQWQTSTGRGLHKVEAPGISRQSAHEGGKAVSPTQRPPLTAEDNCGAHFSCRPSGPQGHSAARRIEAMKNPNNSIWIRTRELASCSLHQLRYRVPLDRRCN
jgi:hypothetical protein